MRYLINFKDIDNQILEDITNNKKEKEIKKKINIFILFLPKSIQEKVKNNLYIYLKKIIKIRQEDIKINLTKIAPIIFRLNYDKKTPKKALIKPKREVNKELIHYQKTGINYIKQSATNRFKTKYYQEIINRYNKYLNTNSMTINQIEMQYRKERQEKELKDLKEKNVKLVYISSHVNCSKRCQKWQGLLYSLDKTYGSIDGIKYQPLENATDIYYTTKKGITYKNGCISGFNCRHKLIPYKRDVNTMLYSNEKIEIKRNQEIKQRQIERKLREIKRKIILDKYFNLDPKYNLKQYNDLYAFYKKYLKDTGLKYEKIRLKQN